jgi:hypothetical protein
MRRSLGRRSLTPPGAGFERAAETLVRATRQLASGVVVSGPRSIPLMGEGTTVSALLR